MSGILPVELYYPIYYFVSAFLTIYYYLQLSKGNGLGNKKNGYGIVLCYAVIFIIIVGLRPISGYYFGDTSNYAVGFEQLQGTPFFDVEDEKQKIKIAVNKS